VLLSTGTLVALYGILEHFGHSFSCVLFGTKSGSLLDRFDVSCWVQDVQTRVFATLGQPNWMAAYMAALFPVAVGFSIAEAVKTKQISRNLPRLFTWIVISIMLFIALLFTRSRSGMLGIAVGFGFVTLASLFKTAEKKTAGIVVALLALFCGLIVFFNGTYIDVIDKYVSLQGIKQQLATHNQPQPTDNTAATKTEKSSGETMMEFGGTESGTIRKYVWEAAFTAWRATGKTFLIGTGTETFAFAFFQYKPKEHNLTSEWDFLYNKAHNEYLNYLTTTGIIGLSSYIILLGMFIVWYVWTLKNTTHHHASGADKDDTIPWQKTNQQSSRR
jgi:O-antigen ligase